MNLKNLFVEIENTDETFAERIDPRRNVIKNFMRFGGRLSLAAIPLALGGLFKKAYGDVPDKITDALQFALSLEHLENRFYATGLGTRGLVPAKDKLNAIGNHEQEHVAFLQKVITSSGSTPVAERKYDFTARGTYPKVFSDYQQFLLVAQAFEDNGVRAYKGQADQLKSSNEILEAGLRIHATEARHAAHIRFVRMINKYANVKPWIVGVDNTKGTSVEAIYRGEDDHRQVGFNIDGIGGYETGNAGTSSFDEPLHRKDVEKIVAPFMV